MSRLCLDGRDVHRNGFPVGMGIPWEWESHGNGNKTQRVSYRLTCTGINIIAAV